MIHRITCIAVLDDDGQPVTSERVGYGFGPLLLWHDEDPAAFGYDPERAVEVTVTWDDGKRDPTTDKAALAVGLALGLGWGGGKRKRGK